MKKMFKKIYVEITNICNLNCSFCSKVEKPKKSISIQEFEHILNEIKDYTDNIYLHVKGEPLLHKDLFEFLKLAENYDINVNITTNGVLFPTKAKELSTYKSLRKINFSLHSENDIDNYEEKIFESVKLLSNETTVIYRLWTLQGGKFDEKNTKTVEKIINYYKLSPEIVEKIYKDNNIKISSTIYVDKDNEFEWPAITNHNSCGYCHALKTHIAILADGTVVPCCLDSNGVIELGNIYKNSLEEIMNSQRYKNLKKSFQDRHPSEELCKSCTYKERKNY